MRRKDREITSVDEILKVIDKCDSCNLGLSRDNMPYVVPLNFGYTYDNDQLVLYFHGATEGKKLDYIKANSNACFSIDTAHKLKPSDKGESYTMLYESVMGFGKVEIITDRDEKLHGLKVLMKAYAPDREFNFPDNVLNAVCVFKLVVAEFSGKSNPPPNH